MGGKKPPTRLIIHDSRDFFMSLPLLNHLGPSLLEELDGSDSKEAKIEGQGGFAFPDLMMYGETFGCNRGVGVANFRPKFLPCNDVPNFCGTVIHPKMDPLQLDMWASNQRKKCGPFPKDKIPRVVKNVIRTDLSFWLAGMTMLHKLLHELQTPVVWDVSVFVHLWKVMLLECKLPAEFWTWFFDRWF